MMTMRESDLRRRLGGTWMLKALLEIVGRRKCVRWILVVAHRSWIKYRASCAAAVMAIPMGPLVGSGGIVAPVNAGHVD